MRLLFLFFVLFTSFACLSQSRNLYVNSVTGSDNNAGTIDKPWKTVSRINKFNFEPGDQLLFAGAQTFGQVQLQSNDNGLKIGSYNGVATLGGIYAYNVGNITIENLNCKGPGMTGNNIDGINFYMDSSAPGDLSTILIQNVSVSNFGGNGILVGAWLTTNGYNEVKVLNSNLYENGMGGFSSYGYKDLVNNTDLYINNVKAYRNYGRTDITSTNTGSGILIGGFNQGIIENCEAYENGKNNRASGGGPQGFWCYNSKNIIFQYCTSHDNKAGRNVDGGGFDIDGGSQNCIIQYCYSYNNDGAGYAFFEHGSTTQFENNIIRYNISQNDARANAHGGIMLWARDTFNRVKNSQIYNNTIYVTPSATASANYPVGVYYKYSSFKNISYFNNIVYTTDTIRILSGSSSSTTFSNNNYYTPGKTVSFKKGGVSVDPLFKNAGGGKTGYVLKGNSPMINAGTTAPVTKDIAGTLVPSNGGYDIGAYEANYTPPVAAAGSDQNITLPANSIFLRGSGTDADGTIEKYVWTKVAGPSPFYICSPGTDTTTVRNLVQGTYTFRLTVTDNDGVSANDDVQVTVNAAPVSGLKMIQVNLYGGTNAYSNAAWNNWNVGTAKATNKSITALKYSDGTTSTVAALLSSTEAVGDNGSTYGGTMAPAEVLRYCSNATTTRTLTLSGLSTSKTYSVEFYASRAKTGYSSIFTIGSTTVTVNTDNNKTTKASFTNLKANSSGQIVVTIKCGTTTNASPYNYLNGFILTEQSGTSSNVTRAAETGEPVIGEFEVTAYPNPAAQNFNLNIKSKSRETIMLQVVDATGRIVENIQGVASNTIYTLGDAYKPGVYYVEVLQNGRKATLKLVKANSN